MRWPSPRRAAAIAVPAVAAISMLTACSGDGASDPSTPTTASSVSITSTASSVPGGSSVEPTAPGTGSAVGGAEASAPTGSSETAATTTTLAPTTTPQPTTTPPPATTTTEPPAVAELVLKPDSIGGAYFGAEPEGVIDYVNSLLGGPTDDTGWVAVGNIGSCGDTVNRRVTWGSLALVFSDLSGYANGRRHFLGWEYGLAGELGTEPVGLHTPGGVTLGSRVVDLLAEFPDATVNPGEDELGVPPNYYVSDVFRGNLTGVDPDSLIVVMFGGEGCGE